MLFKILFLVINAILILIFLPSSAKFVCDVVREWPYLLFLATGFFFLLWGARKGNVDDIVGKKAIVERKGIDRIRELLECSNVDEIVISKKIGL